MSDTIPAFFSAWSMADTDARLAVLNECLSEDATYADPRTPELLTGIAPINAYLGMFSEMAPGMEARVVNTSTTLGQFRATVAFGMPGSDQAQRGQYFVTLAGDGKIAAMVGFVGMGEPE